MALQHLDRYAHAATMLGQARQQAGHDTTAILPSLLYAQIWQDYNLFIPYLSRATRLPHG
jgi:hypothetical protein